MKENKLCNRSIRFLGEEWKEFEKYLASPFFNSGRNYIPLLKLLKTKPGTFSGKIEEHEKLYTKLYPGKPFNKNVINTMLSGFTKMAEDLAQMDYDTFGEGKNIALLRQFEKRNFVNLLSKEVAILLKKNESKSFDLHNFISKIHSGLYCKVFV